MSHGETVFRLADETHSAVRLEAKRVFDDGTVACPSSTSSGFLWRHNECVYVVTCWHCLSGKHPETLKPLGSFFPNRLVVHVRYTEVSKVPGKSYLGSLTHEIATEDLEGNYLWIEHKQGSAVDVAAIRLPITEEDNLFFKCLNDFEFEELYRPAPTSDAFIVGFPEGFRGDRETPIWKRASVASEPDLGFQDRPVVLVDCIGNRGLSGAPVICVANGLLAPDGEQDTGNWSIGRWRKLLGVYAGRLGDCGLAAQMGRVWKAEVISELFD
ncbi:trypsin-like peptidase domain-containing protein [Mameliella alba]|uniref:Trypsin-like peptidase domain-containing protein n=1 Tax=Mameliella alba TaxID=561184 RepID=A0A0B3SS51_9RHOB|nr:trypsin-like peptidase domain-containing protein [Mameliella alba]KHQ53304.1 hypothetical protein OA50_02331 [Mameliella alba]